MKEGLLPENMTPFTLGAGVRLLREQKGWSVPQLARKAEVTSSTVRRIERTSNCRLGLLTKIADALDTYAGVLLELDTAVNMQVNRILRGQSLI